MEFCPHCIRPASDEFCINCGGRIHWTAAPGQLPVGALLRGAGGHNYQIGAARGQGGFGITYAAMNLTNGERVAIKEYYPTRCALRTQLNQVMPMTGQNEIYQGGMKSFLEEAMMLAAVGALPSVVSVKDYFEANGTAYLVMEYVDGVPLHQIVTQQGRMTAEELLPKLPALLTDLDTLHKAGVIHRDISPDNLILMPDGKLKLLDFGSARSVQDGKSMTILLKAGFSPVEQYQSRGQGPWTDVYALAGTIYYCLTGVIPPSAVDRLDEDTLQKPNALGAGLTAAQEDALVWGLVVQPKSRPASMEAFQQRLFPKQQDPASAGGDGPPPSTDPFSKLKDTVADVTKTAKDVTQDAFHNVKETFTSKTNRSGGAEEVLTSKRKKIPLKFILLGIAALIALGVGIWYLTTHGTTEDGYQYRLVNGNHARITGYEGEGGSITIPSEIRGLKVEWIWEPIFAYNDEITSVTVTNDVWPAAEMFVGCDGITTFIFDCDDCPVSFWDDSMTDCKNLGCVFYTSEILYNEYIDNPNLDRVREKNVVECYKGQDTGYGLIKSVEVIDGVVYALTDEKNAVVLQLPEGVDGDSLSETLGLYQVRLPDGRIPGQKDPVYGETEDGYSYYISADRSECMITGYSGNDTVLNMPDEIDGYPVNIIGEKAFAGNTSIKSVLLPYALEAIQDSAFSGCSNLRDIYIFSNCSASFNTFKSCPRLSCAVIESKEYWPINWTLPSYFHIYIAGMETGIGQLSYVYVADDETIYGITEDERAVVLDIPDDTTELYLRENLSDMPVEWVYERALDGLSEDAVIWLPAGTLFPYELCATVDWKFLDGEDAYTLSKCWFYTCYLQVLINDERSSPEMGSSRELALAAKLRAYELSLSKSHTRPNGESWSTALNEFDVDWTYAGTWGNYYSNDQADELLEDLQWLAEKYAAPEEAHDNKYYTSIAVGLFYDNDSKTTYLSCLTIMNE